MYRSHAPSSRRTDRALSTASRDGASTKSKSEGSEIPSIISFSIACPRWIRRISGTDCGRIRSNWSREQSRQHFPQSVLPARPEQASLLNAIARDQTAVSSINVTKYYTNNVRQGKNARRGLNQDTAEIKTVANIVHAVSEICLQRDSRIDPETCSSHHWGHRVNQLKYILHYYYTRLPASFPGQPG